MLPRTWDIFLRVLHSISSTADLDAWNVSAVTDMGCLQALHSISSTADLNAWNVSDVTDMGFDYFQQLVQFNGDLSAWNDLLASFCTCI